MLREFFSRVINFFVADDPDDIPPLSPNESDAEWEAALGREFKLHPAKGIRTMEERIQKLEAERGQIAGAPGQSERQSQIDQEIRDCRQRIGEYRLQLGAQN